MSDEPKKDGFYISVELPKGYEPIPSDSVRFRVNTEIAWHATCWKRGPLADDGCGTTCLLDAGHKDDHAWIRNDEIMG